MPVSRRLKSKVVKGVSILSAIIGLLFGLIAGFALANSFSRYGAGNQKISRVSPITDDELKGKNETPVSPEKLSSDEIKTALAQASSQKSQPLLQKKIALALYNYAAMENDATYLAELRELLQNASNNLGGKDYDLLITLGEISLNAADFEKSAEYFRQALKSKPADIRAQNRLGIVYLKQNNVSAQAKAIEIFEKILKQNPENEEALQNLIAALIQSHQTEKAVQQLNELKKVNAENAAIPDFEIQISQLKLKK